MAFKYGVYGLSTTITSENRKSFLPAFEFETMEDEENVNNIAVDGLKIFNEIYEFKSKSFIAPNYNWGKSLEEAYHYLTVVESVCRVNYLLEVKNAT